MPSFAWAIWWAIMSGRMKCASSFVKEIFPPLPATTMMVWAATATIVAVPTRPMKRRQMVQGPSPIPTRSSPKKTGNSWTNYPVRSGCLSVKIMPGSICCSCMGVRDASTNTSLKTAQTKAWYTSWKKPKPTSCVSVIPINPGTGH